MRVLRNCRRFTRGDGCQFESKCFRNGVVGCGSVKTSLDYLFGVKCVGGMEDFLYSSLNMLVKQEICVAGVAERFVLL